MPGVELCPFHEVVQSDEAEAVRLVCEAGEGPRIGRVKKQDGDCERQQAMYAVRQLERVSVVGDTRFESQ